MSSSFYDVGLWAMGIDVVQDPSLQEGKPLEAWSTDQYGDPEEPEILLVPRLFKAVWSLHTVLDQTDPSWRRFPSLSGKWVDEESHDSVPAAVRLWNLWPVDEEQAVAVQDAFHGFVYSDWLLSLDEFLHYESGEISACEMAHEWDEQRHGDDPNHENGLVGCELADQWLEAKRAQHLYIDEDGMEHFAKPSSPLFHLPWPLNESWEQLLGYSQRNAWASLRAYTDPNEVLDDERRYSPWLFSC